MQAQSLRSSATGVLGRAQLNSRGVFRRIRFQNACHHRGEKLWVPREGRQRPDRSGSGQHRRRDGRIVQMIDQVAVSKVVGAGVVSIAERRLQGTPLMQGTPLLQGTLLPDHLCDHSVSPSK